MPERAALFANNKITWEILKITDRKISITGQAFCNYHDGRSGVNSTNIFSGVFQTPVDRYDFSEIEYVNINPTVYTTFILEAMYKGV